LKLWKRQLVPNQVAEVVLQSMGAQISENRLPFAF